MEKNIKEINCVVSIILDNKNRILLQKKDSGYRLGPNKWSLWGGKIEMGEGASEAIAREIKEETGLETGEYNIHFFRDYVYEGILGNELAKVSHKIFIIRFDGNLERIRLGEGGGFALFENSEIKELNLMEPTKKMLELFYKNDTGL